MGQDFWAPIMKVAAFSLLMALYNWYSHNVARRAPRASGDWKVVECPRWYGGAAIIATIMSSYISAILLYFPDPQDKSYNSASDIYTIIGVLSLFLGVFMGFSALMLFFYRVEFDDYNVRRTWLWSQHLWTWQEAVEMTYSFLGPKLRFSSGETIYVSNSARGYLAFIEQAKLKNVKIQKGLEVL